jgi:hypothetical protein
MFRHVPVYEQDRAALVALGRTMVQPLEDDGKLDTRLPGRDNPRVPEDEQDEDENHSKLPDGTMRLPAGYTYFGQFVDHDITFDPVSKLTRQNDPDALTDFRTPRFDLDSLYGGGPADQPYLYKQLPEGEAVELLLDPDAKDLQRNAQGRALIGDPRNDENLIVSQLQVAFIRFHNAVVSRLRVEYPELDSTSRSNDLLKLAQQTVRWHYQWVVIHDFLPRIVGDDVVGDDDGVVGDILKPEPYKSQQNRGEKIICPKLRFYGWKEQPFMPVEFSVAAYRFGHSMARPSYVLNDWVRAHQPMDPGDFPGASYRVPLFSRDGGQPDELSGLNGFRRLPEHGALEWKYFLQGTADADAQDPHLPQPSYRIDTKLGSPLSQLPASVGRGERSLAIRNLLRGKALGLPAGQDVARAMGITPLEILGEGVSEEVARRTPLWFYILKEADEIAGGAHLGPVGARIVAEVLIGLLAGDPLSYLSVDPTWSPNRNLPGDLPGERYGTFTLTDLINVGLSAE